LRREEQHKELPSPKRSRVPKAGLKRKSLASQRHRTDRLLASLEGPKADRSVELHVLSQKAG
jgi:hypothetical protein